jgi:hypothetical protein
LPVTDGTIGYSRFTVMCATPYAIDDRGHVPECHPLLIYPAEHLEGVDNTIGGLARQLNLSLSQVRG